MYWLATIVSGAPFLGLLGTVWGVMDAFGTMDAGGATIEHLAPGVSGALLTTVAALCVAIPIVFAYNGLLGMTRAAMTKLENFASNLADRIELENGCLNFLPMARDFKRQNKLAVISDLNVTPLIDLAFSLLIIFMITTPVIEQYNRIDLPSQKTSKPQKPPELSDQFITIEADGKFRWGKDPVSQKDLENKLDEVAAKDGEQPTIHIRGDRTLPYQKLWMW